ncbi:MAG: hypothetical protein C0518_08590 [Opitutus sp.]|nr:hypothetical protein [Opitutus sp.]
MDLLERRRLQHWQRLARPDERPPTIDLDPAASEPFALGYPRHHLVTRALLPLALAILVFLVNSAARSDASHPRGQASSELRQ